ncbi:MAG: zinc ribbon domain-containing protein [Actinomycetota bacterium]|nr:zinc ribbon domain-containing protein [Actinomycetota bacterium]
MRDCPHCGGSVDRAFRYCPWCSTPLRRKLVEFFRGHPLVDDGRALRVSRYVDEGHVRFSVWDESGQAKAAVSLDEHETDRLTRFLGRPVRRRPSLLDQLREVARR